MINNVKNLKKVYDIRRIDELHRLRADIYEERKHLSIEEQLKISNEEGKKGWEKVQAMKRVLSNV